MIGQHESMHWRNAFFSSDYTQQVTITRSSVCGFSANRIAALAAIQVKGGFTLLEVGNHTWGISIYLDP